VLTFLLHTIVASDYTSGNFRKPLAYKRGQPPKTSQLARLYCVIEELKENGWTILLIWSNSM